MGDVEAGTDSGALLGAMISGVFGLAWTQWGASGIPGAASGAIRIAGIVLGLVIFFGCARQRRLAPRASGSAASAPAAEGSTSIFSSRAFRLVSALEVVGILGGNALLGATGHDEYIIAWVATVVGIHFVAFGRLFWAGFYWLGVALIAAGTVGATVGLVAGGSSNAIKAVSGLIAAASFFAAGGQTLARARSASPV